MEFAQDPGLQAWSRGMQSFCEYYAGRYDDALNLARDGLRYPDGGPQGVRLLVMERFRNLDRLRNHWSRPSLPRSYYWYLTFPDAADLRLTAARCQQAIAFPYYDPVRTESLHLTLARIGPQSTVTAAQLNAVEAAAERACNEIAPFTVTTGPLSGTRSAVGLSVMPAQPVRALSDALRAATRSARPDAPAAVQQAAPHITIAYANTDNIPAAQVIATIDKLNASITPAEISISTADLVLLERHQHSYDWHLVSRIPLTGTNIQPGFPGPAPPGC